MISCIYGQILIFKGQQIQLRLGKYDSLYGLLNLRSSKFGRCGQEINSILKEVDSIITWVPHQVLQFLIFFLVTITTITKIKIKEVWFEPMTIPNSSGLHDIYRENYDGIHYVGHFIYSWSGCD